MSASQGVRPNPAAPIEAVARAMNWPDLHGPVGGKAAREVRITNWYPNVAGAQVPFLRLVHNGTRFEAQLFVWWPKRDSPPMPRTGAGIRCGERVDSGEVCVKAVPIPAGHDWDDVATRALQLEEPCRPQPVPPGSSGVSGGTLGGVVDGGDLLIEAFDGRAYRTYSCNAPTSGSPARPVDRAAVDLYTLLVGLGRSSPRIR